MLARIAWFEISFWLRSRMLWSFLFIIGLMIFIVSGTDLIPIGTSVSNIFRNAPYVIQNLYAYNGLFTLLMVTPFLNWAALRDFKSNTHELVFSTPLRRRDFLLGRFFGATLISVIPMLGVSLGILAAKYMPWVDPERWEAVNWSAHLHGILVFALPNTFLMAAILFAVAVLARNEIVSFVAAFFLITAYQLGDAFVGDIQHQRMVALLDPFAIRTFSLATKYWTVVEKNTQFVGMTGLLLWNRLIWIAVGCVIFALAYYRFSFTEKGTKNRIVEREEQQAAVPLIALPRLQPDHSSWAKFLGLFQFHFLGMAKSTVFIVMVLATFFDLIPNIALNATQAYGNQTFPVTHWVLLVIRAIMFYSILILSTHYAGALVWKDRDARLDEITDTTSTPEWISYGSRLLTLLTMVMLFELAGMMAGVAVQAWHGYHRYQFGLYIETLVVRDASYFLFLTVLALFIHVLAPNKYVGYFIYIAFLITNTFVWRPLNIITNLAPFGRRPSVLDSDFYGWDPFRPAWNWFTLYWLLFCGLLSIAAVMFWPRGKQDRWRNRSRNAALRFTAPWKAATAVVLAAFAACGGWIWHNTAVLNPLISPNDAARLQADYEKTYNTFLKSPQPGIRSVKYRIDIFPADRNFNLAGDEVIYNPYSHPLDEVHFSLDQKYDTFIEIPGAVLAKDDTRLFYRIYHFNSPLQPGEERTMHFNVKSKNRGFENQVSDLQIVQNGTILALNVAPAIGYDPERELNDPLERKKYGLPRSDLMPPLERNCTDDCRMSFSKDWVDVNTIISTSPDQIAIATGSLVREWRQDGRRYFEYQLDHPSLNFYSFLSARYEVAREEWNGIKLEVYYLKEHPWNVPRMMTSMKKCLDYYTTNFGPYDHKEARIIEHPSKEGILGGGIAFPGTMPYSETAGFIANLSHPDDIDYVFFVVAHEMAHQWWGYQVAGAYMEGTVVLSETLAEYSAIMAMEKEYGRDIMRKFLAYEMAAYLRGRSGARFGENPLITVNVAKRQAYIAYHKGSIVMYYIREMIGEDTVNRALRKIVQKYAYAPPPFPTSNALVDALREETPPNLQYLIKDLFEDIILFSNRTLEATAVKRLDGKYEVTLKVESKKFRADAKGNETEIPVDDWIDIGAFAKPASGRKYGDTLYRERMHITRQNSTFTFTTAQPPDTAGIDPFLLLIDRVPDDNVKSVKLASPPAQRAAKQQFSPGYLWF